MTYAPHLRFRRAAWLCILVGCAGIVLCAVNASSNRGLLWRAYLLGFNACWPIATAAAGLLALGNLTGGRWAEAARPYYMAAMRTIPLITVLAIPLAFGLADIYPWAEFGSASRETFSPGKAAYLSPTFFSCRAAVYLIVWNAIACWLNRVVRFDIAPASTFALRRAGAASLVLLVPTTTFAAFDWSMSLEPHWYSSIYGAIMTAGGVIAAHAAAIIAVAGTPIGVRDAFIEPTSADPHDETPATDATGDLGNLMLAFVMLFTYFSFSQFLIIWSGNLPSEITWYERRLYGGWQIVALAVVFCGFVLPFAMMLSRDLKRSAGGVVMVAAVLMFAYALNTYWMIVPAFPALVTVERIAYAGALVGLMGCWLAIYFFNVGGQARKSEQL
jgi:hypothetical protein